MFHLNISHTEELRNKGLLFKQLQVINMFSSSLNKAIIIRKKVGLSIVYQTSFVVLVLNIMSTISPKTYGIGYLNGKISLR